MDKFNPQELKNIYVPEKESHKGQNGKLMIIGGSHLFHGASLWALKVASRIVDMVFYASTAENNKLTEELKSKLYDFMAIPRSQIEAYVGEADSVLIGPGMVRAEQKLGETNYRIKDLSELDEIEHEGIQTYYITKYLLEKYPQKKWVIDAGALQMMEAEWLKQLNGNVVVTPHHKEFEKLFMKSTNQLINKSTNQQIKNMAEEYNCTILLKGEADIVCSKEKCVEVEGGNVGMTKGGTGDVLAGLVAALACKNDLFLAASSGSYINKQAGNELYKRVGPYFNASDLADEIPKVMNRLVFQ